MICSVKVCTYSLPAGGVQFFRSGDGALAAVRSARMVVALAIQRAIANALFRRMANLFIDHLILWKVDPGYAVAREEERQASILNALMTGSDCRPSFRSCGISNCQYAELTNNLAFVCSFRDGNATT